MLRLRVKSHPDPHICNAFERAARNLLDEILVVFAVAVGRCHLDVQLVAHVLALQFPFQPRYQITVPLQVGEGVSGNGAVEGLAGIVLECVMNGDDGILLHGHDGSPWAARADR